MRVAGVVVLVALLGGLVGCGSDDVELEAPTTTTEPPTTTLEPWPVEYRENFLEACIESFHGPRPVEELNEPQLFLDAGEGCLCVLTNLKTTMSIDEFIVANLWFEAEFASVEDIPAAFTDAVEGCV